MRYLKGSSTCGLLYDKTKCDTNEVVVFVDSDFIGDFDRRKSTSRYVSVVPLSLIEAKFIASTVTVKEAI